ncbi:MAG TPA: response regulator [Gammaproteobacteria bacterium]|nr:response regulator [Gammaproteobacteria bacterium]HQZ87268.1 response regulator [Gammaproteobacteria bacterium]HRA42131.1 response regulator [Gammaproteobacteria bacterium]
MSDMMQNTGAKPLKILFVDNSRTTRTAMSMILAREGYEVIPIATGQEAIEKLQAESFDVVVTDLYMPFMNGHEAAKLIRALPDPCKDVPIIALTASDDPRDMEVCKNAGMNEFIIKSEDNKGLLDTLKTYTQKLGK